MTGEKSQRKQRELVKDKQGLHPNVWDFVVFTYNLRDLDSHTGTAGDRVVLQKVIAKKAKIDMKSTIS